MIDNFTDTELTNERWRDIDGYDGMYQVSDLGRVRSRKSGEWKVIRFGRDKSGYLSVNLSKNKEIKHFYVHRLVASAFIPNDDETKTQINHIDECKQNNSLWNLEWCSASYNLRYNDLNLRKKNGKRRKIAKLYDQNLSINENIEIFKAKGFECSRDTVIRLRKDLGLTNNKRDKLKPLYNPDLSIDDNIKLFMENGIECCRDTVWKLRKELGLIKH